MEADWEKKETQKEAEQSRVHVEQDPVVGLGETPMALELNPRSVLGCWAIYVRDPA